MRYFGTDGIRGKVPAAVDCHLAFALGNAVCQISPNPTVCVGRDTRPSGNALCHSFCAGVLAGGGSVADFGIVPTPAVSYLVLQQGDYGAIVTASHNPEEYNGIKILLSDGEKPDRPTLELLESHLSTPIYRPNGSYTQTEASGYLLFLEAFLPNLHGKTVVLDCANGAASEFAPPVFEKAGATVRRIFCSPSAPINQRCGATYPNALRLAVAESGADFGFSFDGDGDRVIACGKSGRIYDGDDFLYLLAEKLHAECAVGTLMTNRAVERALNTRGIKLHYADVGDSNVLLKCKALDCPIGTEPSGHVLLPRLFPSSDGILSALLLSEEITDYDASPLQKDFRIHKNLAMQAEYTRILPTLYRSAEALSAKYGCRLIVRKSGTEPLLRLTGEGEDEACVRTALTALQNCLLRLSKPL